MLLAANQVRLGWLCNCQAPASVAGSAAAQQLLLPGVQPLTAVSFSSCNGNYLCHSWCQDTAHAVACKPGQLRSQCSAQHEDSSKGSSQ